MSDSNNLHALCDSDKTMSCLKILESVMLVNEKIEQYLLIRQSLHLQSGFSILL